MYITSSYDLATTLHLTQLRIGVLVVERLDNSVKPTRDQPRLYCCSLRAGDLRQQSRDRDTEPLGLLDGRAQDDLNLHGPTGKVVGHHAARQTSLDVGALLDKLWDSVVGDGHALCTGDSDDFFHDGVAERESLRG